MIKNQAMKVKQLLTCLLILWGSIAAHAYDFELNGVYYNITDADSKTVEVTYVENGEGNADFYYGTITIPNRISKDGVTYLVTAIGDDAFHYCANLTSVTLGNNVTRIDSRAFDGCTGLTEIVIPNSVTRIEKEAFSGCSSLASVTLPSQLVSMDNAAFQLCTSLTSIAIPESVTTIGAHAFQNCSKLASVNIPEGVTVINEYLFCGCEALTSIEIPSGVTSIGQLAFNQSGLTSVVIPEGVTTIGNNAFWGCRNMTTASIPASVSSIGNDAFANCSALTSVTLPAGLNTLGGSAFSGCIHLEYVVLCCSPFAIDASAFANTYCPFYVPTESVDTYKTTAGWSEYADRITAATGWTFDAPVPCGDGTANLTFKVTNSNPWEVEVSASPEDIAGALTIPATIENNGLQFAVKAIGERAFRERNGITSVTIEEGIESIYKWAFEFCENNVSVKLPESVKRIAGAAFAYNTKLEIINIPSQMTDIEDWVFARSDALKSITLPERLKSIWNDAFKESGLESIKFPSTLTTIGASAFESCTNLNTIDFSGCTVSIAEVAFGGCTSLETLDIPSTVTLTGYTVFGGCTSLKTVTIHNANNRWNDYVFGGCTALESVVIPSFDVLGYVAFKGCSNLKSVTILSGYPNTNSSHFSSIFENTPDDILFTIPEGTAENFLLRGYKNLSDKSGLPLVREEFEAEAARIATMADAATNGDKASLTAAINAARSTVTSTDDYMTVYAQVAAIKTAAKTFITTATLPENFDVTAATITNPDFDRFDIGWKVPYIGHQIGYQVGSFNGISQLDIEIPLPEAQPVTVGTECYIMNVGTKLFLGKGEAWGTQSIANRTGLKYILKNQRDDNGKIGFLGPNNDGLDADGNEITQLPEGQYWLYSPDISLSDRHSTDRWRDGTCGEGYRCSFTDQTDWDERGVWQLAFLGGNVFTMQVPQGLPNYQDFQNKYVEGEYAGIWPEHGSDWAASNSNGFSYGLYSDIVYADHPDACQFYCVSVAHHDAYLLKQEMIEVIKRADASGIDISNALALMANPSATVEDLQREYNTLLEESKDHFIEAWQGSPTPVSNGQIAQTIKKLPAGVYRLEADMIATLQSDASAEVTGVSLFAGNAKVPVATDNGKPQHFSVKFENATTRDVTIGIDVSGTNANWVAMDNVRLIYESKAAAIPESAELKSSETDTLYLYNVDADKYLSAGHAWSTHAILDETGLPIRLTQNEETGLWQIYFWEGAADQKLLFQEELDQSEAHDQNEDTWVDYHGDHGKAWWNITQASDGTLLIQIEGAAADKYLGNDPEKQDYRIGGYNGYTYTDVNAYVSADKNVHWILFSKAACDMIIAKRKLMDAILRMEASGMTDGATLLSTAKTVYENDEATIKEVIDITTLLNSQMGMPKLNAPVDMTALITNPRFEENTTEGWSGANVVGGRSDATSNHEHEFWNTSFNMYQTITGVPNGRYRLKWKGYHRPGQDDDNADYEAYAAGNDLASAVVYANDETKTMINMFSQMSDTRIYENDREHDGRFNPKSMEGARAYFDAGFYADSLEVEVKDNVLTIGVKNTQSMSGGHWVIFSDFELYIMENEEQIYHKLSAEDVKCVPGVPFTYNINLTNRDEVTAFQFEMTLPEGVSIYEENGQQEVQLTNRSNGHMFSCTKKGEGNTYLFSALSLQSKPFKKNSGALVRMTLQPAEDMELGDYEIQVTNVELSKPNGMQVLPFDFTTTLTVKEADPGDVNGDGMITVTDAVYVFRYVNGQEMPHFQKKAADVNGDKQISINDAVGIVNMILGTSNASLLPSAKGAKGGARVLKRLNVQKLTEARYY